jgi:ATP-dependent RNA helicase DeaD
VKKEKSERPEKKGTMPYGVRPQKSGPPVKGAFVPKHKPAAKPKPGFVEGAATDPKPKPNFGKPNVATQKPNIPIESVASSAPKPAGKPKRKPSAAAAQNAPAPAPYVPAPMVTLRFDELGLPDALFQAVTAAGYESPTPIQAQAIPILLSGKDLIGQAQTGTGKTAAFSLPLLASIDTNNRKTQALVMVPTRELAVQVAGQIHLLGKQSGVRVVPVYGGQPIDRQFKALAMGAHVVVGTPGRVQDHLRRDSLDLSHVTFCALDEADEMLAFGFIEDIETILAKLPEKRQLALFSATLPARIANLIKTFLPNASNVTIRSEHRVVDTLVQTYYEVAPGKKREALARVLDMETPGPTIVFCKTRQETIELADDLRLRGYLAEALNGEMDQSERDRVMKRFKAGQAELLVATDVAARGLDIDTVTHVINYDLPWDVEQYIHRVGRTGRAGRTGDAITLIEPRERRTLRLIEHATGAKITPTRIPTSADIAARRSQLFVQRLRDRLTTGDFERQMTTVSELIEEFDPADIAAATLSLLWEATNAGTVRTDDLADEMAGERERPEGGMARLYIGAGRQDGMTAADVVSSISSELGISGKMIGTIDILDRATFVEVPSHLQDDVIAALTGRKLQGRRVPVRAAY